MIKKIEYENKVSIQNDESIENKNKVTDSDMNEIKEIVNNNADELSTVEKDINDIKSKNTEQDTKIATNETNIKELQTDNTTNKQDIAGIKAEQEVQNNNIELNKTNMQQYVSELEAENSRLREDLNGLPKRQASGESIDLSDSAEMRCDLNISGNSKQKTRSGKNKFIPLPTGSNSGVAITLNMDGTYNLEGTAVNNSENINYIDIEKSGIKEGLTYILSATKDLPEGVLVRAEIYNGKTWVRQFVPSISSTNKTSTGIANFTNATRIRFLVLINSGITVNIKNIGFQLEEGTIATDYEQYGAMPSPDYPSEVESCGDNINLFDKDNANKIQDTFIGITGSVGTATANQIVYVECKKNATITVQKKVSTRFRVATYSSTDIVGKTLSNVKVNDAGTSITITSGEKDTYLFVQYIGPDDKDNSATILKTLKIAYSSKETGYSEYGQGCINEVICNKNLFNENNKLINATINASGEIVTGQDNYLFYIPVKYGYNYTFSFDSSESLTTNIVYGYCNEIPKVGSIATYNIISMSNLNNKLFTPTDSKNKYLCLRLNYKTQYNKMSNIQLEEGQATPYIEHQSQTYTIPTQQPFRAIGDTRDTFIKKNNKWFERHYIQRVIFDGTENFVLSGSLKNTNRFSTNNYKSTFKNAMSSHFKYAYDYNLDEPHFYLNSSSLFLFVNNTISTVAELQAYLAEQYNAGTPVYVDYILETPLDIECTEEQSTILFDIEQNAKTYDKVTHMYSTDNVSPVIDVTYKKDIETLFANTLVEGV